jgi:hypothetical protein
MAKCTQCGRKLPAFSFQKICEWCVRHEAAKRGEEPEDAIQSVMPVPWAAGDSSSVIVTQALFGINIAVFAAMALQGIAMDPNSQQLKTGATTMLQGPPWPTRIKPKACWAKQKLRSKKQGS